MLEPYSSSAVLDEHGLLPAPRKERIQRRELQALVRLTAAHELSHHFAELARSFEQPLPRHGGREHAGLHEPMRDVLVGLQHIDQHTVDLPIACVEGWSTTQHWTGVRLRDLAALAGVDGDAELQVESLQKAGALREVTLSSGQVAAENSLLALKVNGEDLSLDHGFPARVIVPGAPGVHQTKWVATMKFRAA